MCKNMQDLVFDDGYFMYYYFWYCIFCFLHSAKSSTEAHEDKSTDERSTSIPIYNKTNKKTKENIQMEPHITIRDENYWYSKRMMFSLDGCITEKCKVYIKNDLPNVNEIQHVNAKTHKSALTEFISLLLLFWLLYCYNRKKK